MFLDLKEGAVIVSLKPFVPEGFRMNESNVSEHPVRRPSRLLLSLFKEALTGVCVFSATRLRPSYG
jgi:hypothetical protein